MIQDLEDYLIPDAPIDNSMNDEYNEIFKKEAQSYAQDIQMYHKSGRKLTKVDLFPEQCRSKKYFNYNPVNETLMIINNVSNS